MCIVAPGSGPSRSNRCNWWLWVPDPARLARVSGATLGSPFDEGFLDHEMARLAGVAFGKTARFEHLAQLFQHGRAAAHHDAIRPDIERRLADVVEQLL